MSGRHRSHLGRWLAGPLVFLYLLHLAGWLRLLVAVPLAGAVVVVPLALFATAKAGPQLLIPRRIRMRRRKNRPRPPVPGWLHRSVYAADRHRCVYCRSRVQLQLDHIVPWSFGGLTSLWNCATLCGRCNRVKSNYWRSDSGKVYYRAWRNAANQSMAGAILRAELRARYNPLRWVRAGRTWWFQWQWR